MGAGASCLSAVDALNSKVVDLSHFDVQRQLGKGGFGAVNAVTKRSNPEKGKWFALKTLDKHVISEQQLFADVMRELNLLKDLHCPLICNAHYAFQDDHSLYICMDLFLGGDLRYHLQETGPFTVEQTLFFGASLVLALEYLHSQGVLHRDIKPDNILMDQAGHICLTDLGISFSSKALPLTCTSGSGTGGYMAPELYAPGQVHGVPSEAFSLGVVLFELSMGTRPYPADQLDALSSFSHGHMGTMDAFWQAADRLPGADLRRGLESFRDKGKQQDAFHSLLQGLLAIRPERRAGGQGFSSLKTHPAFEGMDWTAIVTRTATPPFRPKADQANVKQDVGEIMDVLGSDEGRTKVPTGPTLSPEVQALFEGWYYDHTRVRRESLNHPKRPSLVNKPRLVRQQPARSILVVAA